MEKAGAASLMLKDQVSPKRCGHMPEVSRSATAVKSCRYAFIVCADGLRVARSIRKSANQCGVAAAVSASEADAQSAAPASRRASAAATGGSSSVIVVHEETAGHIPSVTEKRWIITLIHRYVS
jgi:2-methylisocitrate lyase-like PEP mutase family enzyme